MVFDVMNWKEENIASQFFPKSVCVVLSNASSDKTKKKKQIACAKERTLASFIFFSQRTRERERKEER